MTSTPKPTPKIVPFEAGRSRAENSWFKLPTAVRGIHDKSQLVLTALLNMVFDKTLNHLFDDAQSSRDPGFSLRTFDDIKTLREHEPVITAQWLLDLKSRFLGLQTAQLKTAAQETPIGEVQQWEIQLTHQLNDQLASFDSIDSSLNTRLGFLFKKTLKHPLSADVLTNSFLTAIKRLSLSAHSNEQLTGFFMSCVIQSLGAIYEHIEILLNQADIPAAKDIDQHFTSKHISQISKRKKADSAQADHEAAKIIAQILANKRDDVFISEKNFLKLLDIAQGDPRFSERFANAGQLITQLQQLQIQLQLPGQFGSFIREAAHWVNVLFSALQRTHHLDELPNRYLARLQIPLLKIVFIDRQFTTEPHHPARILINELAEDLANWKSDKDPTHSAPAIRRIDRMSRCIVETFGRDLSFFSRCAEDNPRPGNETVIELSLFESRISREKSHRARADSVTEQALALHDKHLADKRLADTSTHRALAMMTEKVMAPLAAKQLLHATYEPAQKAEEPTSLSLLIALLQPAQSRAERVERSRRLPLFYQQLQRNLQAVSYPLNWVQTVIINLHQQVCDALCGTASIAELAGPVKIPSLQNPPEIVIPCQDTAGSAPADQTPEDRALLEAIDKFTRGALFDWQDNGQTIRCRLAAIIKQTEQFIFINRNGIKVAELSKMALLDRIKTGQITPLDQSRLFDTALEEVVSSLRKGQKSATNTPR